LGNLADLEDLYLYNNQLGGALPATLTNLANLDTFWFQDTNLCEPADTAFQTWLAGIPNLQSAGIICPAATPTATPTNTPTPTATATAICPDFVDPPGVGIEDIMLAANCWRCKCGDTCYDPLYDINDDCDIDIVDIMLMVAHWGETCL